MHLFVVKGFGVALLPYLRTLGIGLAPVVLAHQSRVALGDDIGETLKARAVAILIGERPGLSSPDSLGVYLTWQPHRQRLESERTSTQEIARVAQVSEGTVYKQFKTKEGILRALLAPMIQQVIPSAITEFIHEVGEHHLPDLHTFLTFIVKTQCLLVTKVKMIATI